jgi:hypothetical protein
MKDFFTKAPGQIVILSVLWALFLMWLFICVLGMRP